MKQTGPWENSCAPVQERCGTARVALEATKPTLPLQATLGEGRQRHTPFVDRPLFPRESREVTWSWRPLG